MLIDRFAESRLTEAWSEMMGLGMAWLPEAEWAERFRAAGFGEVTTTRVVDSRGPGDEADFTPSDHCPTFADRVELHEAGTLWIRATK